MGHSFNFSLLSLCILFLSFILGEKHSLLIGFNRCISAICVCHSLKIPNFSYSKISPRLLQLFQHWNEWINLIVFFCLSNNVPICVCFSVNHSHVYIVSWDFHIHTHMHANTGKSTIFRTNRPECIKYNLIFNQREAKSR